MPVASYTNQILTFGKESIYGTAVEPTKQLLSLMMPLQPTVETELFTPSGFSAPSEITVNDDYTTGDGSGKADYNALGYVLASFYGAPTTTTAASGAYQHVFTYDGKTPYDPYSYTLAYGSGNLGRTCAGFVFNRYSFSVNRGGVDFSTGGFAKKMTTGYTMYPRNEIQTITITGAPTAGTFTLTYGANSTAALQYNATAATVQTALTGLASIGSGNVTVTGSAGGPYTVTFTGTLANTDATAITATSSLTGGSSPGVTVTETLKGGAISEVAAKIMYPMQFSVYSDTTGAGIGTSKLLYCYEFSIEPSERIARTRPVNASTSSDSVVETEDAAHNVSMTLGADATADAYLASLRAGTTAFIRLEAIGDEIATSGVKYTMQHDMAIKITSVDAYQSSDGVHVLPISGQVVRDGTWGKAMQVTLKNAVASY